MLFNTHEFLLVFLPITLFLYYISNKCCIVNLGKVVLFLGSLVFIAFSGIVGVAVLLISTVTNYLLNSRMQTCQKQKKLLLILGLVFNIGLLSIFKYFNFVADMVENIRFRMILPLGISFYTFQQIAYLIDTYRNETVRCSFLDYCLFTSFFPKLVQGPIVSHNDIMPQIQNLVGQKMNFDNLSRGIYVFAIGLSKKVLVADHFGKIVDFGYSHISSLNQFEAILTILAYTFQLYFDFSGYCDMASGIALMFNIKLPQNFNSPYKARNISDFWKRWHMTLTSFLTKYIYIPLGGNRKGAVRTFLNIIIVYLISGLWHGTGVTFLFWGFLHGTASVLYRIFKKQYNRIPGILQWIITFIFINITWVFFRAESLGNAIDLLKASICAGGTFSINAELTEILLQPTLISIASRLLTLPVVVVLGTGAALLAALSLPNSTQKMTAFKTTPWHWIKTYVLLMMSILSVSGVSTFLYSNF